MKKKILIQDFSSLERFSYFYAGIGMGIALLSKLIAPLQELTLRISVPPQHPFSKKYKGVQIENQNGIYLTIPHKCFRELILIQSDKTFFNKGWHLTF